MLVVGVIVGGGWLRCEGWSVGEAGCVWCGVGWCGWGASLANSLPEVTSFGSKSRTSTGSTLALAVYSSQGFIVDVLGGAGKLGMP